MTVRHQLDYVAWIAEAAEKSRLHDGADLEPWRQRVQRAYSALVDSMVFEHGDPLPPDVPPSVLPGVWPDVPAGGIPGMTVRHQLTVLRIVAGNSRGHANLHHNSTDSDAWAARVQAAYDAMDHGAAMAMPDTARTASPTPAAKGKKGAKGGKASARRSGKKPAAKSRAKSTKRASGKPARKAARRR
jgi:hypothetical protein